MNNGVARLFVVALAGQARIEAMKAANLSATSPDIVPHGADDFNEMASRLDETSRQMADAANYKD